MDSEASAVVAGDKEICTNRGADVECVEAWVLGYGCGPFMGET